METITRKQLDRKAALINKLLDTEAYYISAENGGYNLLMGSSSGLAYEPLNFGHVSKRDLYQMLSAMILGLCTHRDYIRKQALYGDKSEATND